jgi:acyl carrier protein
VINLKERIKNLFADVLQVEITRILDTTTPDDIDEWDSLNNLNLIVAFEEEFRIDIDPEDIPLMMKNYEIFRTYITNRLID